MNPVRQFIPVTLSRSSLKHRIRARASLTSTIESRGKGKRRERVEKEIREKKRERREKKEVRKKSRKEQKDVGSGEIAGVK